MEDYSDTSDEAQNAKQLSSRRMVLRKEQPSTSLANIMAEAVTESENMNASDETNVPNFRTILNQRGPFVQLTNCAPKEQNTMLMPIRTPAGLAPAKNLSYFTLEQLAAQGNEYVFTDATSLVELRPSTTQTNAYVDNSNAAPNNGSATDISSENYGFPIELIQDASTQQHIEETSSNNDYMQEEATVLNIPSFIVFEGK